MPKKLLLIKAELECENMKKSSKISIRGGSTVCVFIFFCLTKSPKEVRLLSHVERKILKAQFSLLMLINFYIFFGPSGMK